IGSNWIQEENDTAKIKDRVLEALRAHFRPEFLNRIDEIVIFGRLTEKQISKIIDIQLAQIAQRLQERHVDIKLTDAAKAALAKKGYAPAYGARPLKRAFQHLVLDPPARRLLAGEIKEGTTVKVDAAKNDAAELTFTAK